MKIKSLCLLLLFSNALFAQVDLNKIAVEGNYHRVAQIENTNQLVKDYFSNISNKNDTLYVFLCPLMFCPRCEAQISVLQEMMYERNPENPMLLIASYSNVEAAKKYVERKYPFEDVIYDADQSFLSFLSFSTEEPRVVYILKFDRKSGRMLTGGDYPSIDADFVDALIRHNQPMPYYGEQWEGQISINKISSICGNTDVDQAEVFQKILIPTNKDLLISNVIFPEIGSGNFSFVDELDNSVYVYSFSEDLSSMAFVGKFGPSETEEVMFVSENVGIEKYYSLRDQNMALAMCLSSCNVDADRVAFSVSLPNLFMKENGNIAYYNAPAVVLQNLNDLQNREFISFDFVADEKSFFISHEDFYFDPLEDYLFFKMQKGYPYFDLEIEGLNVFDEPFYDDTPLFAIYKQGNRVGQIGQLGSVYKDLHLGYAYVDQAIVSHGKDFAVTDGTSGTVTLYRMDAKSLKSKKVGSADVFPVSADDFSIDTSLYGTDEYAFQFQEKFQNDILDMILDDKKLYTLSIEDNCYFKKTFGRDGKLLEILLIPSQVDGKDVEVVGLFQNGEKVYSVGLYYDKEEHYLILFD